MYRVSSIERRASSIEHRASSIEHNSGIVRHRRPDSSSCVQCAGLTELELFVVHKADGGGRTPLQRSPPHRGQGRDATERRTARDEFTRNHPPPPTSPAESPNLFSYPSIPKQFSRKYPRSARAIRRNAILPETSVDHENRSKRGRTVHSCDGLARRGLYIYFGR